MAYSATVMVAGSVFLCLILVCVVFFLVSFYLQSESSDVKAR